MKRDWLVQNRAENGAPGGIRTPDTWFRRPVLYPLSYGRLILRVYQTRWLHQLDS